MLTCSTTLAGIEGRISGLLFAKSLLKTGTTFDLLPTEWALSLPTSSVVPVFPSEVSLKRENIYSTISSSYEQDLVFQREK